MPAVLALLLLALFQTPAPADTLDTSPDETAEELSDATDLIAETGTTASNDDDERPGVQFRPRIAPSALYSVNRGFGIGGGVGIQNLVAPGTDLAIDLRLQQRFQSADVTLLTNDPYDSRFHVLANVGGSTTGRRRYYGLGPNTLRDSELNLFHDAAQAELRAGWYPLGTTALYLQPGVRMLYDYSGGVNEQDSQGMLEVFDPASRAAVDVAEDRHRYGASVGLEVATDLRDWPSYPRRGMLATVEHRRFFAFDDSELALSRYSGSVIGYVPIRGRTTILLRAVGLFTRSGDADGDGDPDTIPFYYLPVLDDRVATAFRHERLTGRDVVAAGAGIRAPVFDFLGVYGIDVLVMGYLGNAYENVFEQFSPRISFREGRSVTDELGRAALRPSLGVGLGLVNLDKERVVLGGLVGVGPGGVTLATLRVAYDLRDARPLFR